MRISRQWFEEFCLLGFDAFQYDEIHLPFRRKISAPSSKFKSKPNKKSAGSIQQKRLCLLYAGLLLELLFSLKDGANIFLRNVWWFSTDYTALYPRR
jgi:hypothetical protein